MTRGIFGGMASTATRSSASRVLTTGVGAIAIVVAVMWFVEIVDTVLFADQLQGQFGIFPRRGSGLDGIVFAPLLHADFGHLIANTLPFIVLSGLVMTRGVKRWLGVTVIVAVLGGGLTWLLAGSGNHIGASGVVFGYLGYLVATAAFERRMGPAVVALIAVALYGGAVVGFLPQAGISWESHLFGAIAGVATARFLAKR